MITRYNDLAANERTYLAWMRTALSLIAFGFVLERFDLLLRNFGNLIGHEELGNLSPASRFAGITLVGLGLVTLLLSTWRFIMTVRSIKSESEEVYGSRTVLFLGGIFILLSLFVLLYITKVISCPVVSLS